VNCFCISSMESFFSMLSFVFTPAAFFIVSFFCRISRILDEIQPQQFPHLLSRSLPSFPFSLPPFSLPPLSSSTRPLLSYLTVHVPLPRHALQLVGVTALWMAAKIEEIYPPRASDFVLTTDNAYSVADMIRTELQMLEGLRWNMVCQGALVFGFW
jgi:hypothetical protein